jgi:DNA-binding NarL/FixJ family response regulator
MTVLTTSNTEEDILRSYQHHANGYVTKPVPADGFLDVVKQINYFFGSVARLPLAGDG